VRRRLDPGLSDLNSDAIRSFWAATVSQNPARRGPAAPVGRRAGGVVQRSLKCSGGDRQAAHISVANLI